MAKTRTRKTEAEPMPDLLEALGWVCPPKPAAEPEIAAPTPTEPDLSIPKEPAQLEFSESEEYARAKAEVPEELGKKYWELRMDAYEPEDALRLATVGMHLSPQRAEYLGGLCEKLITIVDRHTMEMRLSQVAEELAAREDAIALREYRDGVVPDWTTARREARNSLAEEKALPRPLLAKAADLADAQTRSTPAKLAKLEAAKRDLATQLYPELRMNADHDGAVYELNRVCRDKVGGPIRGSWLGELERSLTKDQTEKARENEKARGEVVAKHYLAGREAGKTPSKSLRDAITEMQRELQCDYATHDPELTAEVLEERREKEQKQIYKITDPQQLGAVDKFGLSPLHAAAAMGKLSEFADVIAANPQLLYASAGHNGDMLALAGKLRSYVQAVDLKGVTVAQMAAHFGHEDQLPPGTPKQDLTKQQRITLGRDPQEMLTLQYYPLVAIAATKTKGQDPTEAFSRASVAFAKSLDHYDAGLGYTLAQSSALAVNGAVIDMARSESSRTKAQQAEHETLEEIRGELWVALGDQPTEAQMAKRIGCSITQYRQMEERCVTTTEVSLDQEIGEEGGATIGDMIAQEPEEVSEDALEQIDLTEEDRKGVRQAFAELARELDPASRTVLTMVKASGCLQKEVAWVLGQDEKAVSVIMADINERLAQKIQPVVEEIRRRRENEAPTRQEPGKQAQAKTEPASNQARDLAALARRLAGGGAERQVSDPAKPQEAEKGPEQE